MLRKHRVFYRVESLRRGIIQENESLPDKLVVVVHVAVVTSPDLQPKIRGGGRRPSVLYEQVEVLQDAGGQRVFRVNHDRVQVAADSRAAFRLT